MLIELVNHQGSEDENIFIEWNNSKLVLFLYKLMSGRYFKQKLVVVTATAPGKIAQSCLNETTILWEHRLNHSEISWYQTIPDNNTQLKMG